ncbi:hypothetical protein HK096_000016 [Nowakowskiella sp. JEL0078]|nr:hypothetical protein HK096_000016 [Nowakowskiella sp. JEL0078]
MKTVLCLDLFFLFFPFSSLDLSLLFVPFFSLRSFSTNKSPYDSKYLEDTEDFRIVGRVVKSFNVPVKTFKKELFCEALNKSNDEFSFILNDVLNPRYDRSETPITIESLASDLIVKYNNFTDPKYKGIPIEALYVAGLRIFLKFIPTIPRDIHNPNNFMTLDLLKIEWVVFNLNGAYTPVITGLLNEGLTQYIISWPKSKVTKFSIIELPYPTDVPSNPVTPPITHTDYYDDHGNFIYSDQISSTLYNGLLPVDSTIINYKPTDYVDYTEPTSEYELPYKLLGTHNSIAIVPTTEHNDLIND